jgi:hypothetical protein
MIFPLDLLNISLLLAIISIVLLVTSGLLSPHYRRTNILINKKKLRNAAVFFAFLFVASIAIRIVILIFAI